MSLSRRLSQETVSSTFVTHWAAMSDWQQAEETTEINIYYVHKMLNFSVVCPIRDIANIWRGYSRIVSPKPDVQMHLFIIQNNKLNNDCVNGTTAGAQMQ